MFKKPLSLTVIVAFIFSTLTPFPQAHADTVLNLPSPGTMIDLSPAYEPVIIKGLTVHKDNPFLFDFIVDVGQDKMSGEPLKKEGEKLIKYFLASLAIPDRDLWVNLSPYEKNKMIPEALGQTDMGRDLLEQDYILKQMTASLIYPEKQLGKKFWDRVYAKAQEMYGTTQVPVNTFNKVWIMADRAEIFEHDQTAFVVDQHLKVMLEQDYLSLRKHADIGVTEGGVSPADRNAVRTDGDTRGQDPKINRLGSQIVREIVLPELEKEVNTGKNFSNLRQIFNSIILSSWYKKNLQEALLNQVYADRSKVKGINLNDPTVKQQIYQQYLKAYRKGVFNYIKEDVNTAGETIPRKYFSGGMEEGKAADPAMTTDPAVLANSLPDREMVDINAGILTQNPVSADQKGDSDEAMITQESTLSPQALQVIEKIRQRNAHVAKFVEEQAIMMGAKDIEVIGQEDEPRLIQEGLDKGDLIQTEDGNYLGKSHPGDVQRVVERTMVATRNPNDKGKYNNWRDSQYVLDMVMPKFKDALKGTGKMYVVPYIMEPEGADFDMPSIQVTNSAYVALQSITMAGVGEEAWRTLGKSEKFHKGIHFTGDLDNLRRDPQYRDAYDDRWFVSLPDEGYGMTISYGSNYGGNVLFGKKFEGLRLGSWVAAKDPAGKMAEHMALVEMINIQTGEKRYFAFAAPSNSGKTNFAMMKVPQAFAGKYQMKVISDDLVKIRVGEDGRLYAFNPERGIFGVVTDTNERTNPNFWHSIGPNTGTIFTNMAYKLNADGKAELWWKGKTKDFPEDITGWHDWTGKLISSRVVTQEAVDEVAKKRSEYKGLTVAQLTSEQLNDVRKRMATWEHPNGRATTKLKNVPSLSAEFNNPKGVPIDAFFFGGRVPTEGFIPPIRKLKDFNQGLYSLMTMFVASTAAEAGAVGVKRRDPAAMLPFLSLHEIDYFKNWIKVKNIVESKGAQMPAFFQTNWFIQDKNGNFMWPGYEDNMRLLDWAWRMLDGKAKFQETPVGLLPDTTDINTQGMNISQDTLKRLFTVKTDLWRTETDESLAYLESLTDEDHPLPHPFIEANLELRKGLGMPIDEGDANDQAMMAQAESNVEIGDVLAQLDEEYDFDGIGIGDDKILAIRDFLQGRLNIDDAARSLSINIGLAKEILRRGEDILRDYTPEKITVLSDQEWYGILNHTFTLEALQAIRIRLMRLGGDHTNEIIAVNKAIKLAERLDTGGGFKAVPPGAVIKRLKVSVNFPNSPAIQKNFSTTDVRAVLIALRRNLETLPRHVIYAQSILKGLISEIPQGAGFQLTPTQNSWVLSGNRQAFEGWVKQRQGQLSRDYAMSSVERPDIKRIGILTGGGLATGHNSLIAAALREAQAQGPDVQILGIPNGWAGLVNADLKSQIRPLSIQEMERYENQGGSLIKSSRTNPVKVNGEGIDEETRSSLTADKVAGLIKTLKDMKIDGLIVMGGDDTNGVSSIIHAYAPDFPILGVPKTMDNDVYLPGGAPTYGYDSFVTSAAESLRNIKRSAIDQERVMVVETFGRDSGFTTIGAGARAGATLSLIPENGKVDIDQLVARVRAFYNEHHYALIVVSEGIKFDRIQKEGAVDEFGHEKLVDAGKDIAEILSARLKDIKGLKVSQAGNLDYATREAPISLEDAMITQSLGRAAVQFLRDGITGKILYTDNNYRTKAMSFPNAEGVVTYVDYDRTQKTMNISQLRGDGSHVSADVRRKIGGRIAHIAEGEVDHDTYVAANQAIFGERSDIMRIQLGLDRISKEMSFSITKISQLLELNEQVKSFLFEINDIKSSVSDRDLLSQHANYLKLKLVELIREQAVRISARETDAAMSAALSTKGGIDLNTANGMQWKVNKDGNGVEMNIDPAMIERVRREGVDWLSPVIFKMTPVSSVWPLLGLQAPA